MTHAATSSAIEPIRFAGPTATDPLAFRYYDKDRIVLGKRMEDHLRFAVCYWHTFAWNGFDVFGARHLRAPLARARPTRWQQARAKADVGVRVLQEASACRSSRFHDRDVAPEGSDARARPTSNLAPHRRRARGASMQRHAA